MSNFATEPLTRITINLYTKDIKLLQELYESGYQVEIRKIIRSWVREWKELRDVG